MNNPNQVSPNNTDLQQLKQLLIKAALAALQIGGLFAFKVLESKLKSGNTNAGN